MKYLNAAGGHMKLKLFMGFDKGYCHLLHLPGSRWVCNRFDRWVMDDGQEG
jgi:hypothetical protein